MEIENNAIINFNGVVLNNATTINEILRAGIEILPNEETDNEESNDETESTTSTCDPGKVKINIKSVSINTENYICELFAISSQLEFGLGQDFPLILIDKNNNVIEMILHVNNFPYYSSVIIQLKNNNNKIFSKEIDLSNKIVKDYKDYDPNNIWPLVKITPEQYKKEMEKLERQRDRKDIPWQLRGAWTGI